MNVRNKHATFILSPLLHGFHTLTTLNSHGWADSAMFKYIWWRRTRRVFSFLFPAAPHTPHETLEHIKYHMKPTFKHLLCFSAPSLTKPSGGPALRSVCVISGRHLLSGQKSAGGSRVQCYSGRSFFSPPPPPPPPSRHRRRRFQPTQALLGARVFPDYDLKLRS